MAIKSKSSLRAKWLKACAVLLALVMAGAFAVSVSRVVTLTENLGGSLDSLLQEDRSDFTASNAFQQQLATDLFYIRQMLFVYGSEEDMRSGASLKKQEELLRQEYEQNLQSQLAAAREEAEESDRRQQQTETNEYGYAEPSAAETQSTGPSGETAEAEETTETTEPKGTLSAEKEAEIRERCQQQYEGQLRTLRMGFEEDYRKAKKALAGYANLHYALVNQETGAVFTNFEEIDPQSTDFRQLVEQNKWNESYTKDTGYHSGERVVDRTQWLTTSAFIVSDHIWNWFHQYSDRLSLYEKEFVNRGWNVYIGLNDKLVSTGLDGESDVYFALSQEFATAQDALPASLAAASACLLVYLACAVYLVGVCGRRTGEEEAVLLWTDRIPNDLHLLLSGTLVCLLGAGAVYTISSLYHSTEAMGNLMLLASACCTTGVGGVILEWLTSVARNLKRRQFWRNTIIAKAFFLLRKGWRRFRKALRNVKEDVKAHMIPKHEMQNLRASILFLFAGYLLLNMILIAFTVFATQAGTPVFFLFFAGLAVLFNSFVLITFWKSVIALDEIMTAVSKTRQGDLSYPLKTEKMPRLLRKFGEDVVGMQDGLRAAVDEAIKGEHMKTELITNVSHDLKTPLTAIVNYVDLLKKCEISDERAQGYIGVLEEKSERLKHLIEDLVEASKATTGNVQLQFIKVNLHELAMQAVGESEDAMAAAGLDIRLNTPEKEPILYADNQKTWRIIDNLISNVKKYAMPGTRVYVDVNEDNGFGVFSIKNISREPLDVPVEQLTQRFVRGDAARSTEGSGLGLSIAQSLCELQHGTLEIALDGDLFKVTVRLPLARQAE